MDFLRFRLSSSSNNDDGQALEGGHVMCWPDDQPEQACFECSSCHLPIEESEKHAMLAAGEWRACAPEVRGIDGRLHASFHIWAAYSTSPNASWAKIAAEFLATKREGHEKLKTFINTWLGETWKEKGEAPDWERLYERRELYKTGSVNERVRMLTCGVDVQRDRFVYEVVGWAPGKENWSVDAGELHGDTALDATWLQLDELLERPFAEHRIRMMAIDSGAFTQQVYNWVRRKDRTRVMAIKGAQGSMAPLLGTPTPVEVNYGGKRIQRGLKLWHVGGHAAKSELYGQLRLRIAEGEPPPPGYCHFPEYGEEFFKQLTAEHIVIHRRAGRTVVQWEEIPNRENHALDARVYARAAAARLGLDRMSAEEQPRATAGAVAPAAPNAEQPQTSTPAQSPALPPRQGGTFGASIWGSGRSRAPW